MQSEKLIELSTRIVYGIDGVNGELKVYWNRFLRFSFSDEFSVTQIRQLEIRAASRPIGDNLETLPFFNKLTIDEQTWVLAALKFLQNHARISRNWIGDRNIENKISGLPSRATVASVSKNLTQISVAFSEFEKRKVFVISGGLAIILIDYMLRWIFLLIAIPMGFNLDGIVGLNFSLVWPIIILAWLWSRRDKRLNAELIAKNDFNSQYKVRFRYTTFQYTLLGFCVVSGGAVSNLIQNTTDYSLGFGSSFLLILFYFFLMNAFPVGRLSEYALLTQVHDDEKRSLDADGNDEAIVLLETELNSKTGRLEAYVLESALFGALAFSGFLQIIATNLISFADLEKFSATLYKVSQAALLGKSNDYDQFSLVLKTQVNLFCLISIETLICSAFFLAVIAARLRFSDIGDKIRSSINLAKAFNEKEEVMLAGADSYNTSRFNSINTKIALHLQDAEKYLLQIGPIVSYMIYFRNAGLLTFLTVLVSSSLFITSTLAWGFIYIGIGTWVYFNFTSIRSWVAASLLGISVFFTRQNRMLFALALSPGLLGFTLRIGLKWNNTDGFVALSFILVVLYCYVWLVLMPHHDRWFENEEQKQSGIWQSRRWIVILNVYGILVLLTGFTFGLIVIVRPGTTELLLITLVGISILNFFIAPYLIRPKWMGSVAAILLSSGILGILFRILHLNGANELTLFGCVSLTALLILSLFKRKIFHYILLRVTLISLIFIFAYSNFIFSPSLMQRFQFIYEHKTIAINEVSKVYYEILQPMNEHGGISRSALATSIAACNRYVARYGTSCGKTEMYRIAMAYYDDVGSARMDPNDTARLNTALLAARQINVISGLFKYSSGEVTMEADVLERLGRTEEARISLTQILKVIDDGSQKKEIVERLKRIEAKNPQERK